MRHTRNIDSKRKVASRGFHQNHAGDQPDNMNLLRYYVKESYKDFERADWFVLFAWIAFVALLALAVHYIL